MRKILLLLLLFAGFIASAQDPFSKYVPERNYGKKSLRLKIDSAQTLPDDTLMSAPCNSIAFKNDLFYQKNCGDGIWHLISGGSVARINDSIFLIGSDTMKIKGGGGNPNSNLGSGYRIAVAGTNNIKTLAPNIGRFITWDSSFANVLIPVLDTNGLYNDFASKRPFKTKVDTSNGLRVGGVNNDSLYYVGSGGGGSADYNVVTAPATANYTITSGTYINLSDLAGQANRTVTLPASPIAGRTYIIQNLNTIASGFDWSFSGGTVKDRGGNTITTLNQSSKYTLIYLGSSIYQIQD